MRRKGRRLQCACASYCRPVGELRDALDQFTVTGQASIILGIETSCDETAAAIVVRDGFGRRHDSLQCGAQPARRTCGLWRRGAGTGGAGACDAISTTSSRQACGEAGIALADVDAIAATAGPGLIGGVLVGLTTAKALAAALDKPLIAVNHLEAHALTARLTDGVQFPYLMLLVSGGHSQFVLVRGVGDYERWGTTIDDALGEAFDKVAKLLDLGHPGGPAVEQAAQTGDPKRFKFPRPLLSEERLDFSFSGLKTAVRLAAEAIAPLSDQDVADICAGFQAAVTEIVATRAAVGAGAVPCGIAGQPSHSWWSRAASRPTRRSARPAAARPKRRAPR